MVIRLQLWLLLALASLCSVSFAQSIQDPDNNILPDGSAYLWVEAESFLEAADNPEVGFIKVSSADPIQTITETDDGLEVVNGGLDVLPANTNASGREAIFAQLGGGGTATWQVQFAIPATYYMYIHWSMYNRDTNTNYGNEDSFYVPPTFNTDSRDAWIGHEGVDLAGDPKTGDSNRDGYVDGFPTIAQRYQSAGEVEAHNSTDEEFYEGQFHWYWVEKANEMDADNNFLSFDGHAILYDVTDADVGTVMDFQISYREPYGAIDGILFSTSNELLFNFTQEQLYDMVIGSDTVVGDFDGSGALDLADVNMLNAEIAGGTNNADFDLNGDSNVNGDDLNIWVKDLRQTWFGDGNLDSEFNSGDLVNVFQEGKYDQDEAAGWNQGDWNGDLRFDSGDLVIAFQDGGYELGPPAAANAVPEPSSLILVLFGLLAFMQRRA